MLAYFYLRFIGQALQAVNDHRQALDSDPLNLIYRQALRGIERRKYNNDPSKIGRMIGTKTGPIRLRSKAPTV